MSEDAFLGALAHIFHLHNAGRFTPAADEFRRLIASAPDDVLHIQGHSARELAKQFLLPGLRQELTGLLDSRHPASPTPGMPKPPVGKPSSAPSPLAAARNRLREGLAILSKWHIFQWSTFYREEISQTFDSFAALILQTGSAADAADILRDAFADHTRDIFSKAVQKRQEDLADIDVAVAKSLNGLERFLDLPVASYLATASRTREPAAVESVRVTCSAMLSGILLGFGSTKFGGGTGWAVLLGPTATTRWGYALAFLTPGDLRRLIKVLGNDPLAGGLTAAVAPLAEAIDGLLNQPHFLVPVVGEFEPGTTPRLTIRLNSPGLAGGTWLSVLCLLSTQAATRYELENLTDRGATVLIAPVRSDLHGWATNQGFRVVSPLLSDGEAGTPTAEAVERLLARALADYSEGGEEAPIPYNYVSDFPLEKPGRIKSYFVPRPSVRGLLRTFEQRTGAHLWCSIRRSGKTTAGFDLSSATGAATVVSQTCDSTGLLAGDDIFFTRFQLAQENTRNGRQLSPTFFVDAVRAATPDKKAADRKTVFVLDEYETLFGHLRLAEDDPALRYRLVQPLLNQMVAFSRDNLLILLGMRPDAHYVLMEQNQLSPLVVQDQFPLFAHTPGGGRSEFGDLLAKAVRMGAADIDAGFADALHAETGGHPFLTINLLSEVFEWLIACRRSARGLRLTEADYRAFSAVGLTAVAVDRSVAYSIMREVVRRALTDSLRRQDPWQYAVFALLRHLARESPDTLLLAYDQAVEFLRRLGLGGWSIDPDHVLRMAERANLFVIRSEGIQPRIPLLARLARSIPDRIDP